MTAKLLTHEARKEPRSSQSGAPVSGVAPFARAVSAPPWLNETYRNCTFEDVPMGSGYNAAVMVTSTIAQWYAAIARWYAALPQSNLAQWLAAVGTVGAVLLALFRDFFYERMRKPKLVVTCENAPPWTLRTPAFANNWTGDSYWVRIKVENKGQTRAEKVQVCLSKLWYRSDPAGAFEEVQRQHLPLNLQWSHYGVPILDGISPEMPALCDVIALSQPNNPNWPKPADTPPNTTIGSLRLEVLLPPEFHSLKPGFWKLSLRIGAANIKAFDKTLLFSHTGEWKQNDAEMRRECLKVSLE
jgi:hypothetical protein